ncbi:hypothetical protein AXK11_05050 [Cephaloticoccus primus]|uniref:Uncharacterized protein n=1 Tax=Cephaloticoccus primus TaxID=1548207 RepID=A0A139SN10_9BACT|nr:hypothetical protein AXK11_05050 [Cephaloticoccus primus]
MRYQRVERACVGGVFSVVGEVGLFVERARVCCVAYFEGDALKPGFEELVDLRTRLEIVVGLKGVPGLAVLERHKGIGG